MCLACAAGALASAPGAVEPFPEGAVSLDLDPGPVLDGGVCWTGTAGLRLDVGATAIALDPFVSRPGIFATLFQRPRPDEARVATRFAGLDAVFVGHTHHDHAMDLAAVARASPGAKLHGSRTTVELGRRLGVDEGRLVTVADGERYEAGPFAVEAIASAHGLVPVIRYVDRKDLARRGLPWTPFRYPMGPVLAWRIEVGGRAFHVQGSAGIDDDALARQRPVDVLFACLAARRGTKDYLLRLGERLRPRVLVPIHHDDFFRPIERPPRLLPGLDWETFLDEADAVRERFGTRLVLLPFDRRIPFRTEPGS